MLKEFQRLLRKDSSCLALSQEM